MQFCKSIRTVQSFLNASVFKSNQLCLSNWSNSVSSNEVIPANQFVYTIQKRNYAMRLELTEYGITWKRPEKIKVWRPENTGDLIPFPQIDLSQPVVAVKNVEKELSQLNEKTRQLFSLEFGGEQEVLKKAYNLAKCQLQRHKYDETSTEVIIGYQTMLIRFLQEIVASKRVVKRKMRPMRLKLEHSIARRKSRLGKLRKLDYKRYEWLLEQLQLTYKPVPLPEQLEDVTRKSSLQKIITLHCEEMINKKLAQYRLELETLKGPFLKEKREGLLWIAETEKKLGLTPTVKVPEDDSMPYLLEVKPDKKIKKPELEVTISRN